MGEPMSGGCQCGAVRFRVERLRDDAHVCHCRMCQKASGNFFAALVGVSLGDFTWTRGQPASFASSEHVRRGFCARCGTPLFYCPEDSDVIAMTIGSFDHPERIPLAFQSGMEGRLPQIDQLDDLKDHGTTEDDDPAAAASIKASCRQHPDHDTTTWSTA